MGAEPRCLIVVAALALACSGESGTSGGNNGPSGEPEPPMPELLPGIEALEIADPAAHWSRESGFVLMQPPVHLPTAVYGASRVEVQLKLPEGSTIAVRPDGPGGAPNLHLPPGTVADRVEYVRFGKGAEQTWVVGDVRGGSITADGQRFHVLRPTTFGRGAGLFGYSWTRGDAAANARVHERVAHAMRWQGRGFVGRRKDPGAAAKSYVKLSTCDGCHLRNKPAYRIRGDIKAADMWRPNRATDAAGYYGVLGVLRDEVVLEGGRPAERNHEDPLVTVTCPDGPPEFIKNEKTGAQRYRCRDGSLPRGRRDTAAGLARNDEVTKRLCEARRYLFEHMDAAGREAFAEGFVSCGLMATPVAPTPPAATGDATP